MFVGGMMAALMSPLASLFNSSATLFTVDFYKKYRPQSTEKHLVMVGRISLFTKKPSAEQIQGLTYGSATPEQIEETRRSWGAWDILHTVIILAIVVAFYIIFW